IRRSRGIARIHMPSRVDRMGRLHPAMGRADCVYAFALAWRWIIVGFIVCDALVIGSEPCVRPLRIGIWAPELFSAAPAGPLGPLAAGAIWRHSIRIAGHAIRFCFALFGQLVLLRRLLRLVQYRCFSIILCLDPSHVVVKAGATRFAVSGKLHVTWRC